MENKYQIIIFTNIAILIMGTIIYDTFTDNKVPSVNCDCPEQKEYPRVECTKIDYVNGCIIYPSFSFY